MKKFFRGALKILTQTAGLLVLLSFTAFMPALADSYEYYMTVKVYNNSASDLTNVPCLLAINNTQLAGYGYINADGLDTYVQEGATNITSSVATTRTGILISSLGARQERTYRYMLDYSPKRTTLPIMVGVGGNMTVSDASSIELGDTFEIELKGYIETSSGADKNLIYKDSAFKLYISAASSIKAEITGGSSATATGISSGVLTVKVVADVTNLKIYVDDVEKDSTAMTGAVPDNGNALVVAENEAIPYLEYLKVSAE